MDPLPPQNHVFGYLVTTQVQGFTVQGFRLRRMREMKIKRFEDIEAWQPVESPSALRHVDELMSSRSGPKGLKVE
jgi:hypothetical protein